MSINYLNFICTKEMFNGHTDASVVEFDAYENYDILTEFYDGCPECCSFPKEEYFGDGQNDKWVDYVIWENGKIASRAGVWKVSDQEWEVAGVITRPEYRQKGYSTKVICHCTAKILEQGKRAILSTAETNYPMIGAAEKAGFRIREIWDAYTKDGKLADRLLVRGEPIPEGLYHLTCEVLVRHTDGTYLCMKRAVTKSAYPGYYEATSGGAALRGETPLQCIKRELREETGIVCEEFEQVGYYVSRNTIYYSFACTVDCDKASVTLQEGETEGYKWMTEEEFIRFVNSDRMIDTQKKRFREYFAKLGYIS